MCVLPWIGRFGRWGGGGGSLNLSGTVVSLSKTFTGIVLVNNQ